MKKIIAVMALVVGYLGLTYYAGIIAEQNIRQQVALTQQQSTSKQLQLQIREYDRGWFRSRVVLRATQPEAEVDEAVELIARARLWHGPLTFAQGIKPGWFYASGEIELAETSAGQNARLRKVVGDRLGAMNLWGKLSGAYQFSWDIPAIEYREPEGSVKVAASKWLSEGRFDSRDGVHQLAMGEAALTSGRTSVSLSPLTIRAEVEFIADDIPLTQVHTQVERAEIRTGVNMALEGIDYRQSQRAREQVVDTQVDIRIQSLQSFVALSQIQIQAAAEGTSFEAIRNATRLTEQWQTDSAALPSDEQIMALIKPLLHDSTRVTWLAHASADKGEIHSEMELTYASNPQFPLDALVLDDLPQVIAAQAELRVGEKIVQRSPLMFLMADYIERYTQHRNGAYVVPANYDKGILRINNQPVSWDELGW
ncbi:DUF945 family protein [Gilvimarinus xylanilyticus]|uniref:YdgA family protein n=1 Tax=Gilvimarinus xylanilyticus TaxID=2944139 RepID=A0A9X2I2T2_9GAMM|nr:DUF945 family protein [Gilvimarinus xylanilyticus]MCP8897887.1 YdgA family protein [Gilvimarinus xylanilyticus]